MSGIFRARRVTGALLATTMVAGGLLTVLGGTTPASAQSQLPAVPVRINLTQQDLEFILAQIQIAEAHPFGNDTLCTDPAFLTNPLVCNNSVPNKVVPFGIRQTDGRNNNLVPGQGDFGAVDRAFPRITAPKWIAADGLFFDPDGPGPLTVGSPTSYTQNSGYVVDKDPRIISNLISDQTERNPAATDAAAETQGHGFGAETTTVDHDRNPATPAITQYILPNVAPDAGFSASYNSLFTLFGQFFDHGLDLAAKGGSGTVFVPLQEDDPLYVPGSPSNFMVLTRATNEPGPDGQLGTADDIKDAHNQVTPYIDNNQTYTSHPAHQVFLREYAIDANGHPVSTGKLLNGADGGLAKWDDVQAQARNLLGIELLDTDVFDVPLLATDAYGNFLPGLDGLPQFVLANGTMMEGNLQTPVSAATAGAVRTGHAFLNDIAHHAAPDKYDHDRNPATPKIAMVADTDPGTTDDADPSTYDDEMLGAHYICGDGRCNENIGLTAIHSIFHGEHNGLVDQIQSLATTLPNASPASLAAWLLPDGSWNGTRLFQAAKFVNEMEYQHIAFGEFARAIQPNVNLFDTYNPSVDPAVTAEFAHAVYRFGHSMLRETVDRVNADGTRNDIGLMQAFLNPIEFTSDGNGGTLTPEQAAGAIVRGMVNQRGEEIDEFITEALRNNLVGLPLDLASLNITRARSEGIGSLNEVRRDLFEGSVAGAAGNTQLKPYTDWNDFGLALRHPSSLVNFIAAYGTHPSILAATDNAGRRAAANAIVNGVGDVPADAVDFLDGTGAWTNVDGLSITGLEDIDLWIGGLAEAPPLFSGMLGSTFNFVFESQMEALQDSDRLYYLLRNEGLPLLAELEATTFADLIRRNTDAANIPTLAFTAPDWTIDLSTPNITSTFLDGISKLVRLADGTIRMTGGGTTENHTTWIGTNGDDKVRAAEGDDSIWGADGNDTLEGGIGADMINGDYGRDVLTDSTGDDIIEGGPGADVIHGGRGLDMLIGGDDSDAIFHGADAAESMGGSGDDLLIGGADTDALSGGPGQDWIEGGLAGDFLVGDERAAFALITGEDDVLIGEGGDDRYLAEGGMDIIMAGNGIDTSNGGLGFDFVSYDRAFTSVLADLSLPQIAVGAAVNPRERFSLVEGVAGGPFDDELRGDDRIRLVGHELTQASMDKVLGLEAFLAEADMLGIPGAINMYTGDDIVLGGAGSDKVEGGGGADLIDGDATIEVSLVCTKVDGTVVELPTVRSMQNELTARRLTPDQCQYQRAFVRQPNTGDLDTAVYRFPQAEYVVGQLPDGRIIVSHVPANGGGGGGGGGVNGGGAANEGTDILLNVEQIQFLDGLMTLGTPADLNTSPVGDVVIAPFPVVGDVLTPDNTVFDVDGITAGTETYTWYSWDGITVDPVFGDATWVQIATGATYTVQPTDIDHQLMVIFSYTDGLTNVEAVPSLPTSSVVDNVIVPAISTLTLDVPVVIDSPTVTLTATFLDANGLPIEGADVTFDQGGTVLGVVPTDPAGTAALVVTLLDVPGTVLEFTASAIDPLATDPLLANVVSLTEGRLAEYPTVSMTATDVVTEGAAGDVTPLTATITIDRPSPNDVLVDWVATGNTATDGADFTGAAGTATILAGDTQAVISIDVLGDALVEGDEIVDITITGATGALPFEPLTLPAVIMDDDLPVLSLGADPVVNEADGTVTFELLLDQVAVNPVSVEWTLLGGSAGAGTDYVDDFGTAAFAPGMQSTLVTVSIVDDAVVEFDETFTLELGAVAGAVPSVTTSMTATVFDDDAPILSVGPNVQVLEGGRNARNPLNFTITLDRPSVYPVDVDWTAGAGTATPTTDFTPISGTVTIPAGSLSATVTVRTVGDTTIEPNETLVFSVVGVLNAVVGNASATGTILDDDTPPAATINNVTATEGNAGTKSFTFTITLSKAPTSTVSVVATTANGTARAPGDYRAVNTTVTFAAGQTTRTVTVPVVGNRVREPNETFQVRLSRATGMTILVGTGTGTIVNDD